MSGKAPRRRSRRNYEGKPAVDHQYRDWADAKLEDIPKIEHRNDVRFPEMLYGMLESVERQGCQHIVGWQPHNRSFIVRDYEKFVGILSRHFNTSKAKSFHRNLNMYGFKRLTTSLDNGAYYHPCFLRGKPFLLKMIIREERKGTMKRLAPNPENEPDFWNGMPWVHLGDDQQDTTRASEPVTPLGITGYVASGMEERTTVQSGSSSNIPQAHLYQGPPLYPGVINMSQLAVSNGLLDIVPSTLLPPPAPAVPPPHPSLLSAKTTGTDRHACEQDLVWKLPESWHK